MLFFTAESTICAILHIKEAKVAIISLHLVSLISLSKVSHITDSLGVLPALVAFVLSENIRSTPSCQIRAIFAKSAGLSTAGV